MRRIDLSNFQVATSETAPDINRHIVLNLIRTHQPISRADLARHSGLQRSTVSAIERLCAQYPQVKFLVTFLLRENQHELCVAARKFNNLMPFGCRARCSPYVRGRFQRMGWTILKNPVNPV